MTEVESKSDIETTTEIQIPINSECSEVTPAENSESNARRSTRLATVPTVLYSESRTNRLVSSSTNEDEDMAASIFHAAYGEMPDKDEDWMRMQLCYAAKGRWPTSEELVNEIGMYVSFHTKVPKIPEPQYSSVFKDSAFAKKWRSKS